MTFHYSSSPVTGSHRAAKAFSPPMLTIIAGGVATILFLLYAYNSGYGYDALEYLVIARSLLDGYSFYSFIPSKSPGIYLLLSAFFALGIPQSHFGVACIVAFLFAALIGTTYVVTKVLFSTHVAIFASALVAVCAATMELNFVEPEAPLAICSLLAFYCLRRYCQRCSPRDLAQPLFVAGLWVGIAATFKVVALFYWVAVIGFIFYVSRRESVPFRLWASQLVWLTTGVLLPQLVQLIYFGSSGRAVQFLFWTYLYPLFHYPPDILNASRFVVKCGWFLALLGAVLIVVPKTLRHTSSMERYPLLLCAAMGAAPLLSLAKSQASHYFLPSAVFLSLFVSYVVVRSSTQIRNKVVRIALLGGVCLSFALGIGLAAFVRPDVFWRFITVRSYLSETAVSLRIRQLLGPSGRLLAFRDAPYLYWTTNTYPPVPFVNFDRQTTYWIERNPDALVRALDDERLQVVEFDPSNVTWTNPEGVQRKVIRTVLDDFHNRLLALYDPLPSDEAHGHFLWLRQSHLGRP